jgi:hypothetical protein
MITNRSLNLILISLILLFICCNRNDSPCDEGLQTKYYTADFSEDELKKVPYNGFDTLYFLSNDGDTCIVRGTGKEFFIEQSIDRGIPLCPPNSITNCQAYKIHFVSLRGNFDFTIQQKRLGREIIIKRDNLNFNHIIFTKEYDLLKKQEIINQYYLDTVIINKYKYSEVNRALVVRNGVVIADTSYNLLINRIDGLLLYQNNNKNEEFTIIKKQ